MNWIVDFFDSRVMQDVQEWPAGIKAKFLWIAELIEEQGPQGIGMPYVGAFGGGLFEIRAKGKEGIGRAIFCILVEKKITILNAFIKKTQKTPRREIEIAMKRVKELKNNEQATHLKNF